MPKDIYQQIEDRRKAKGVSKYRLALLTEQSQQAIGQMMKGERNPTLKKVQDVVEALGGEITIVWKD